jgi:hypothetical protein
MGPRGANSFALPALQVFASLSAIAGGLALIAGTLTFPSEWLTNSLFSDYVVPGVILATVVGGSQLVALLSSFGRRDSYLLTTAVAGGILIGWIIGEIVIVGTSDAVMFGYQFVYFIVGFIELGLASRELRQRLSSE